MPRSAASRASVFAETVFVLTALVACGGKKVDVAPPDASDDASADGPFDGALDAASDAPPDGPLPGDGGLVDLSTESACCLGVATVPGEGTFVAHVGLDTGRVRVGPAVVDLDDVPTSAGHLDGLLFYCLEGEATGEVLTVDVATGAVTGTGAPCEAVTSSDDDGVLVLRPGQEVRVFADLADLGADDASATHTVTGTYTRIAHGDGELVTAWHATDHVSRGALGAARTDVSLADFDDLVLGVDLLDDGRIVVVSRAALGIRLFDGTNGQDEGGVVPEGDVTFDGVACGDGPTYCPGP